MTNLIKISKLLKKQNITTEEQNITITAKKLEEYINYVIKTKTTYDKGGIKIEWINEKNAVNVNIEGTIKGNLELIYTEVKTIKAKKVLGNIDVKFLETLEEINVEKEIEGNLDIRWTKVKTIKAKQVGGSIKANGVKTLKVINVTEGIEGNLDIRGTEIDFQLGIIKKIKNGELKVNRRIFYDKKQINILKNNKTIEVNIRTLLTYIRNVQKTKEDYNTEGIEIKWVNGQNAVDVNIEGNIRGNLLLKYTKVRKIKAKNVWGSIEANGLKTLEEIEIEEEIGGNLDISGTKVKKIKAKKILGGINANGAETLKKIDVKKRIDGGLDIRGTNVKFQLGIIKKIQNGKLEVNGERYFGGNIEGIEQLCNDKNLIIPGYLDIEGTNVEEINLKKVLGDIYANGATKLKKINVGEINVGTYTKGGLYIRWTKTKKISIQKIQGDIFANGVKTLEEIDVSEGIINGDLYIEGTNIDFQLGILEKIENGKLKISGALFYDYEVINILKNNKTTERQNIIIDAQKLLEYIKKVENGENVSNIKGVTITKIKENGGIVVDVQGVIKGDLNIEGTKVRTIKAKAILGNINATGVETLEEIDVTEGVINGNLDIRGTKVKTIKAKQIWGGIFANGVKTLEEINVKKEIEWDLDIRGTSINFQKKIQIQNGELKVNGKKYFGGNIEGIEQLCNDKNLIIPGSLDIRGTNVEEINLKKVLGNIWANGVTTLKVINVTEGIEGNLDIRGTSIELQKKVLKKKKNGELKINGKIFYDTAKINILKNNKTTNNKTIEVNIRTLLTYIENVEKTKKDYNTEGIEIKWVNGQNAVDVNIEGNIRGNLLLKYTKVRKIKAKNVWGSIEANGLKTLEEIEIEEVVRGNLNIEGTKVRKIKAKNVWGSINANGVTTLKVINVIEGIEGNLDIRGTSIELQKKVLKKKKNGELKINGKILYDKEAIK